MSALLELRGIEKRYRLPGNGWGAPARVLHALRGIDFVLERGQSLALVGESGSGKSTTARIALGLERADAGQLLFEGEDLTRASRARWRALRKRVQLVFQDPGAALDPRQRVEALLAEPYLIHSTLKPGQRRLRALGLLAAVGLPANALLRYPHEFSGGQRQRLCIARALALEPQLLVLDEAVSALDVSVQAEILNLLADLRSELGLSYLFISHDLSVVRHLCERVAVLYLGRIVEEGPRDALFAAPLHPYTRALLACVPEPHTALRSAPLAGEPPSPFAPPSGCAFHPRCSERQRVAHERCQRESPALRPQGPGRSACHLWEQAGAQP